MRKPNNMEKQFYPSRQSEPLHGPISQPRGVKGIFLNMRNIEKWHELQSEKLSKSELEVGNLKFIDMNKLFEWSEKTKDLMNEIFIHNAKNNTITINSSYKYEIDLDRIATESNLLWWLDHLSAKTCMPKELLREFIRRVAQIKGWNYGR